MTTEVDHLNRLSLLDFPDLFVSLSPPSIGSMSGLYRGKLIGPRWSRRLGGILLVITGLGGWWGKEFDLQGNAINLVWRNREILHRFPMHLVEQKSYIDHKPGLVLRYASSNPFPWPWIVDELRSVTQELVLGMTIAKFGPLNRLPLPFILQPRETIDGL